MLKAAAGAVAAKLVERLEHRLMLSVSTNAAGWTVVTPSSDSRLIYVSSSGGNDANSGLSAAAPVSSISHAYSLLRPGYPDWLLLKRGDAFSGYFSAYSAAGRSASEPMVFTSYGDPTLPRPIVDSGVNIAFRTGSNSHDVFVLGVSFTSSTHNPSSPNYTGQGNYGFYDLGGTTDIRIEDCSFDNFLTDITFQGFYGPLYNITVRRSQILDAWATTGHSQGLYADTVTGLTLQDNVFDHDGWNASVPGAQPTIYNHDCYLHSSNNNVVVTGNIFADASSFGLQARAGGVVDDNLFINDPYAFSFGLVNGATTRAGGVTGEVIGNVILGSRQDPSGWGIGAMIGNLKVGGGTVVANNLFDGGGGSQPAIQFQPGNAVSNPAQEVGLNTLVVSNNIVYGWGFGLSLASSFIPGAVGSTGLTAVVIRNNDFQSNVSGRIVSQGATYDPRFEDWSSNVYASSTASQSKWFQLQGSLISLATWTSQIEPTAISATIPFVNPNRSVTSYMSDQGLTSSLAAFVSGARALNAQNWNPLYLAASVASYMQAGFTVAATAPLVTAVPPADVTNDNYQSNPAPTFTVTYSYSQAGPPPPIAGVNINVTGAGAYSLPVSLVGTSITGSTVVATYQVSPSNGDWTTVPSGTYVISMGSGQVLNATGNTSIGLPLGSFQVLVSGLSTQPVGAATTPATLTATAGASSIVVSWTDPAADQQSFMLVRALDPAFTQQVKSYPLPSDAISFTDNATTVGTPYYYELTATNADGSSSPTAMASATVLPPAPALSSVILNDGNAARTAIMSASVVFSTPVTVNASAITLVQNPTGSATPVAAAIANPTGDGRTWIVSWTTSSFNNALPDGSYALTVHGAQIADAFGQTAGGDQTTTFASAVGPTIKGVAVLNQSAPNAVSITFDSDVSGSLSPGALQAINSAKKVLSPASVSWNAATLTATWTFAGALPDGAYTLKALSSAITNADGVKLDGGAVGIPGVDYSWSFTQVKPTLTLTGAANVNAGGTYVLNLGAITDVGQTAPSYVVHWGDGNTSTYATGGAVTYSYATAQGATTISVDVVDANGVHANCAALNLSVNALTLGVSGGPLIAPMVPYNLTLGPVKDVGFSVSQYLVHWGDGSSNAYTALGTYAHTYASGGATGATISVDVVDNSGAGGTSFTYPAVATLAVPIAGLPSVALSGLANANAGGTYTLNLSPPVDPSGVVQQLAINWGDGSPLQNLPPSAISVTHTFTTATAPSLDQISVNLTDNNLTYNGVGQLAVTVNPPPTVPLAGAYSQALNAYQLTVLPAVDVGETVSQYTINWGDGSTTVSPTPGQFMHAYASGQTGNITVDLTDNTGTYLAAGSLSGTVGSLNPTVSLLGNASANAGGTYTLNIASYADPGQTVSNLAVHWGDGQTTNVSGAGPLTHTYAASGTDAITVDLTDGSGVYTAAGQLAVTVSVPSVTLSGSASGTVGAPYALTIAPASDAGGTPQQYVIHWGDGATDTFAQPGTYTHNYASPQSAAITADLVDNTGTFAAVGALPVNVMGTSAGQAQISGAAVATVGSSYTLNLAAPADPTLSYVISWGDGQFSNASSPGSAQHTFTYAGWNQIGVEAVSPSGARWSIGAMNVLVTPQAQATQAVHVGQRFNMNLKSYVPAGVTNPVFTIFWGDGHVSRGITTLTAAHTYTAAGNDTLVVQTSANGAQVATATVLMSVLARPTVSLALTHNTDGSYLLNISDLDNSGYAATSFIIHWGDGKTSIVSGVGQYTHTMVKSPRPTISVDLVDATGLETSIASIPIASATAA